MKGYVRHPAAGADEKTLREEHRLVCISRGGSSLKITGTKPERPSRTEEEMDLTNNPEISVIVPVYKVEEYLDECVQSILQQTFSDFELILADDGSPDRCPEMCDGYAQKDNRVRVIHKENGGLSDARNAGIDIARGNYYVFVDSDDYITSDHLEYLHDAALQYDADIVQGNRSMYPEKLGQDRPDRRNASFRVREFDTKEALADFLTYTTQYTNVWAKIYKSSLFKKTRFPKGKLSEDEYTTYRLILDSKKVVCLPRMIYYYRIRPGSIVHTFGEDRFAPCDEVPDLLRRTVREAGLDLEKELDYKDMRLQLKVYNDFVQGGAYEQHKAHLDLLADRIKALKPDKTIWEKKYTTIRTLLKTAPGLYRKTVQKHRKL